MTFITVILISFPEAILVAMLGLVLVGVRPRWRQLAAIGALQAGAAYLVRLSPVPFGAHTVFLAAVFVGVIRLVVRMDWRVAALAGLLGLTIYEAIETVTVPLLIHLTGYPLTHVLKHPYLRIPFFIPEAALLGLITWLCRRFGFNLLGPPPGYQVDSSEWHSLNRSYFLVYLLAILPVILLAILNTAFLASRTGAFPTRYLSVFLIGMALAVLILTALTPIKIQAVSRAVAGAYAAGKTAESLMHIGELLRLVRRQHHDFHHELQTVYGLLETGCCEEARQYIRKTHETISAPLELIRTDNLYVTALLYTKLALAEAKQIRLEPVTECSLEKLPLNLLEVASLFGNLLDNALEAVENNPSEERIVHLEIKRDQKGCFISVANRGRLDITQRTRLFQEGCTTKEGHAGLGLASVRKIVEKYGGTITVTCHGNETVFRVSLPLDEHASAV
ncbi:MAG: GHKL domain-containing protein [Bacillota bacterium]